MLLILATSLSFAGTVEAWAPEFPQNDYLAGNGWENGWSQDEWYSFEYDGVVYASPLYDSGDDGAFGDGGAHDNWITNAAEDVKQGEFIVTVYVDDDDGWGVVFGAEDDQRYLMLFCGYDSNGSGTDCPSPDLDVPGSVLLLISGNDVEVLDQSDRSVESDSDNEVVISMNDGELSVSVGRIEYSATVGADFVLNGVGFYGYNQGMYEDNGQADNSSAYFHDPVLSWHDDDDDGVVDDLDNCEKASNADQADADGDGIGTACDDVEDTDTGTDSGTGDTAGGNGDGNGPVLTAPGVCSCAVTDRSAGVLLLGLAALASSRRRRP